MRCPNCGWHVRGGAGFCPNCGAEMPSEGPRACPHCHAEVKGEVSLCPTCGAALDAELPAPAPEPPPAPAKPAEAPAEEKDDEARTCPSCKSKLTGKVGICPICGEDLTGRPPAARRPRAEDGWPFGTTAAAARRPVAGKMKPLSPNWPFDEPEPSAKVKRSGKKAKAAGAGTPVGTEGGAARPAAAGPAGEGRPVEPKPPAAATPAAAPRPPAAAQPPAGERPESRRPGEAAKAPGAPAAPERPPEVKPWYVARPMSEAKPTLPLRARQEVMPAPPPRPRAESRPKPAGRPARSLLPRQRLGLLPWLGGLAGVVVVSILVYGFAVGGLQLPRLGGAGQAKEATPTVQATEPPTQAPQPTPTGTPPPPTPTPQPLVHVVEPGESLLSIAQRFGIAVEDLIAANSITQGDVLRVGQELVIPGVPAPTAEATPAPSEAPAQPTTEPAGAPTETPAASETPATQPTPQPTVTAALEFPAPNLLNPPDGSVFGAEDILLNWSSVGLLGDDTWYVVKIWTDDPNQPTPATGWTRTTAWRIPVSSRPPADAASHTFHWSITVMRAVEGQEAVAVSPVSETRSFEWK